MERLVASSNPLAAKQARAVALQDRWGEWPAFFFHNITAEQIAQAASSPQLAEAELLYREILQQSAALPVGAVGVTRFQLALLLHRQGRLGEAASEYEQAIRVCRLQPDETETQTWVLMRSLFRWGEIVATSDPQRARCMFEDARGLAEQRHDKKWVQASDLAVDVLGL